MRLNKKHFDYFCRRCLYWQKELGVMNWEIDFTFEYEEGNRGSVFTHNYARIATITLNTRWEPDNYKAIDRTAFHEVVEIVLSDYNDALAVRNVDEITRNKMAHDVIRRLENLIFKP